VSYYAPDEPEMPVVRSARSDGVEVLAALVAVVAVAVGGVVLGLAWYLVAPPLPLKKMEGGLAYTSPDPEQLVAQDGWFSILGFAFGLLAALAAWTLMKRWRGPVQLFAVTIGAIVAGFLAWTIGTHIDQNEYQQNVARAPVGAVIERPIELSVSSTKICFRKKRCIAIRAGDILVPGLGAVIGYSLLAGWSRWPSLRREDEESNVEPIGPSLSA
jgi:Protein of unknown function (DUF2567)